MPLIIIDRGQLALRMEPYSFISQHFFDRIAKFWTCDREGLRFRCVQIYGYRLL